MSGRAARAALLISTALAAGCGPRTSRDSERAEQVMISPKVVSIHTPDSSSPEAIVASIILPGMTQDEKAMAIWEYCWKNTFHWPAPKEGRRKTHELDVVFDAGKLLNVYGYSYCFAIRSLGEALYEAAGLEARSGGISGHVVAEVYYDGKYHFLDHDQRGFSRLPDGSIASLEDYRGRAAELILDATRPSRPFFPATLKPMAPYEEKHIFTGYLLNQLKHYRQHDKYRTAHSMSFPLLPGMRFTRSWDACGKWHCPPGFAGGNRFDGYGDPYDGPRELFTDEYREARRLDDGGPLRYANGLLVYRPDLGEGSRDFEAGVFAHENVDARGGGFGPAKAGKVARADFRIRLPYVIAGWPGDIAKPDDVSGAAVLSGRFRRTMKSDRLRALVSIDNGATWREVWAAAKTGESGFATDFSPIVEGRYDYMMRFEMKAAGAPGDLRLLSIGLDTACQLNPATLPAVRSGENRMTVSFEPGPEVFDETVQYFDRAAHERLLVSARGVQIGRGSYPTLGPKKRGELAHVVYAMRAPKGRLIRWARAGGAFRSHWDVAAAPDEVYRIYYSVDRPGRWKLLWEADRPPYIGHWCFETDRDVSLRRGAKAVFVKYELKRSREGGGGGRMVAARMAWGCGPQGRGGGGAGVRVTHNWKQGRGECSESRVVRRSGESYSFKAGRGVRNSSIVLELAGRPPAEDSPHPLMLRAPRVERKPIADAKKISAMRAALRRLERNPTAATAADLMRNGPHNWVRNTMPAAMMAIGTPEAIAELKKAVGESPPAEDCWLEMLAHKGPLEDLTVRLKKTGPQHRAKAARLLGVRGDGAAAAPLRAAIAGEKNASALADECAALVRCAGSDAAAEVVGVLGRLGVRGRVRVAEALAAAGVPEGFAELAAALGEENRYVRFEAARALRRSGRGEAEKPLLKALRDRCRWVRREAIAGLGRLGGSAATAPLERIRKADRETDLRAEARWALERIRSRASGGRRRHK